ncbi:AtzE family amidohydrolase [Sphingopyxis sp.]|uniref:AtzE family amidohydrolase n=1 Tax=Sphingopyxis sp. TaxID=1908224 RepID=UPI002ED87133
MIDSRPLLDQSAETIAAAVRSRQYSARALVFECLTRAERCDVPINSITRLLKVRALAEADAVDAKVAAGIDPGPLAGVPYGVKDLFDVAGFPTTAGAGFRRNAERATHDAMAVERLRDAGAILVATLNMDEFAYGFATVNAAWGTTRNPHDPERLAGGSSGGSAAAVAAGILPFTLGSDTNGSVRIPASLCGIWGLKPTHGTLPMGGVFPFVETLDDIGPFARSARDLSLIRGALKCEFSESASPYKLRIGRLCGWFAQNVTPPVQEAIDVLAAAIGGVEEVELSGASRARSAAFIMTAMEGGARHLPELRRRPLEFDPATRDRLIAGAAFPAEAGDKAAAVREEFRTEVARLFDRFDILIAPTVPGIAPRFDDPVVEVDGINMPARSSLGLFTQPISFAGLPVVAAPVGAHDGMPFGVQLIGAPGSDALLLAFAADLERRGLLGLGILPS